MDDDDNRVAVKRPPQVTTSTTTKTASFTIKILNSTTTKPPDEIDGHLQRDSVIVVLKDASKLHLLQQKQQRQASSSTTSNGNITIEKGLVHTDKLNASSPLLFVKAPDRAANRERLVAEGSSLIVATKQLPLDHSSTTFKPSQITSSSSSSSKQNYSLKTTNTNTNTNRNSTHQGSRPEAATSNPRTQRVSKVLKQANNSMNVTSHQISSNQNSGSGSGHSKKQPEVQLELLQLEIAATSLRLSWQLQQHENQLAISQNSQNQPIDEVKPNLGKLANQTEQLPVASKLISNATEWEDQQQLISMARGSFNDEPAKKSLGDSLLVSPSETSRANSTPPTTAPITTSTPAPTSQTINETTTSRPRDGTSKAPANRHRAIWLIRLRPFGSTHWDLVKLVLNGAPKRRSTSGQLGMRHPVRSISFTNLDPELAYEICIESCSQGSLRDPQGILLSEGLVLTTSSANQGDQTLTTTMCQPTLGSDGGSEKLIENSDIKCREFYTTHNDTSRLTFGRMPPGYETDPQQQQHPTSQFLDVAGSEQDLYHLRRAKSLEGQQQQQQTARELDLTASSSVFKPSSDSRIRNRIELIEIDETPPGELSSEGPQSPGPSWLNYQIPVSRLLAPANQDLSSHFVTRQDAIEQRASMGVAMHATNGTTRQLLAMGWSMPPLLGYIFAVIFLLAIVNLLINSTSALGHLCSATAEGGGGGDDDESASKRRRRKAAARQSPTGLSMGPSLSLNLDGISPSSRSMSGPTGRNSYLSQQQQFHQDRLGSPRLMVVGGHQNQSFSWKPFSQSAAALHELPLSEHYWSAGSALSPSAAISTKTTERQKRAKKTANGRSSKNVDQQILPGSSSTGAKSKATRQVLSLVNEARFPLGPSFEGNGEHNADMVGLARKNYDQFINRIYNDGSLDDELDHINSPSIDQHQLEQILRPIVTSSSSDSDQHRTFNMSEARHRAGHHQHRKRSHLHHLDQIQARPQSEQLTTSSVAADPEEQQQQPINQSVRVRYDKINPLYKMNQTAPVGADQAPVRSLKSFGSPNGPTAGKSRTPGSSSSKEALISLSSSQELVGCQDDDCPEGHAMSGLYECCLDRQQQRFQQQQQQLDRRPTLNGSILPQPFIEPMFGLDQPSEPTGGYPTSQLDEEIIATVQSPTPSTNWPPIPPPPPLPPATSSAGLLRIASPQIVSETQHPVEIDTASVTCRTELEELPKPRQHEQQSGFPSPKKSICQVTAAQSPMPEIIKRTDFEQRRQELKNKLLFNIVNRAPMS